MLPRRAGAVTTGTPPRPDAAAPGGADAEVAGAFLVSPSMAPGTNAYVTIPTRATAINHGQSRRMPQLVPSRSPVATVDRQTAAYAVRRTVEETNDYGMCRM